MGASNILVFQLLADIFQGSPARVTHGNYAITTFHIQVPPALWAQALTFRAANLLQRKCQQDLLFQHVFQQNALALIVTDFRLGAADRNLIPTPVHTLRPVEQVKILVYSPLNWIEAARAMHLHLDGECADQANIVHRLPCAPVFPNQLRPASGMYRRLLLDVVSQINNPWVEIFIKRDLPELKFLYFYEHTTTPEYQIRVKMSRVVIRNLGVTPENAGE